MCQALARNPFLSRIQRSMGAALIDAGNLISEMRQRKEPGEHGEAAFLPGNCESGLCVCVAFRKTTAKVNGNRFSHHFPRGGDVILERIRSNAPLIQSTTIPRVPSSFSKMRFLFFGWLEKLIFYPFDPEPHARGCTLSHLLCNKCLIIPSSWITELYIYKRETD